MGYIVSILLFIIAIPLVLFLIFKPVMADKKARNNVNNSDLSRQHYCFVLDCTQAEALDKLSVRNVGDFLEYDLSKDGITLVFSHLGAEIEHQLSFYVVDNKTYLKVSRVKRISTQSNIPLMVNRFFVEKLGAVPVDYSQFEASVGTSSK